MDIVRKICLTVLLLIPPHEAAAMDLMKTYELALQQDPTLRAAEASRNAVLESKPQSIARLLPTLAFTGSLSRNSVKVKTTPIVLQSRQNTGFWDNVMTLRLTQPIYRHDLWVQLSQADSQIASAEADYAAEQQNVAFRATRAYFDVLLAEANLTFARAEKLAIERQLEQATARFEVGLIAVTDVKVSQAAFDEAKAREILNENQLDNAKEALKQIIGDFDEELSKLQADIPFDRPDPDNIERWDDIAQQNNLSIVAAVNRAELAKKGIDLQFAGHMPTLDLIGDVNFLDTDRPRGTSSQSQSIGMELKVPIFEGGGVNSRVRQARFEFEAATENLDAQRRSVKTQVKNAYRGVISSVGQVQALKTALASTATALEAEEAGFEVGTRTMVDVLVVQRNLFETKRDYAQAVYDYIINSLTLKQAASLLGRDDIEWINRWLTARAVSDGIDEMPGGGPTGAAPNPPDERAYP